MDSQENKFDSLESSQKQVMQWILDFAVFLNLEEVIQAVQISTGVMQSTDYADNSSQYGRLLLHALKGLIAKDRFAEALRQLEYESLQDVARSEQGQYVITQLKRQNILQPLRESKPNFELLSLRMELLDETDDAEFIDELKQFQAIKTPKKTPSKKDLSTILHKYDIEEAKTDMINRLDELITESSLFEKPLLQQIAHDYIEGLYLPGVKQRPENPIEDNSKENTSKEHNSNENNLSKDKTSKKSTRANMIDGTSGVAVEWSDSEATPPKKAARSSGQNISNPLVFTRRRKWTVEEEDNLLKGIAKYGRSHWKPICQNFDFHQRSPMDLKDKWRNLLRKNEDDTWARLNTFQQEFDEAIAQAEEEKKQKKAQRAQERQQKMDQRKKEQESEKVQEVEESSNEEEGEPLKKKGRKSSPSQEEEQRKRPPTRSSNPMPSRRDKRQSRKSVA